MEPEGISAETAVKGLAVLTAIPVVGMALWADYFGRYAEALAKENPDFDRPNEILKVRLASLFALVFQFILFLATADIRREYPIAANVMFMSAMILQILIQNAAEKRVNPAIQAKTSEGVGLALRALFWSALGGVLYISLLFVCLRGALLVGQAFKATPAIATGLMIAGSIAGVVGGLGLAFALGPFQMRRMFPTSRLTDERFRNTLDDCFSKAGVSPPDYWILELSRFNRGNALITGFRSGRGIFRPALFLSASLVSGLSEAELRAVVLHEISHMRLHHMRKRFVLSSGMILAASLAAGMLVIVAHLINPGGPANSLVGLLTIFSSFVMTLRFLEKQNRLQEIEADITAVKLGASIADLEGALRKLDQMNGQPTDRAEPSSKLSGSGHPSTEERIKIIHAYFERNPLPNAATVESPGVDKAA